MPTDITDGNQDMVAEFRQQLTHDNVELIAQAVHQISHDVHAMAADIRKLREAWDKHGKVVEGFQTGGFLGARAARKAVGNGRVQ